MHGKLNELSLCKWRKIPDILQECFANKNAISILYNCESKKDFKSVELYKVNRPWHGETFLKLFIHPVGL